MTHTVALLVLKKHTTFIKHDTNHSNQVTSIVFGQIMAQSHGSLALLLEPLSVYSESYNTSLMGAVMRLAFSSATCPAIFILSEQEIVRLQTGQVACM